jgi:hypothetical protein
MMYESQLRENVVNIKSIIKSSVSAIALAAAVAVPAHAEVFQDFNVTYGGVTITADKITGTYAEIFTATSATTFTTSAYAWLTTFTSNEGLGSPKTTKNHNLYATFTADGNILGGGSTFQGTTGKINLYLDPSEDTTLVLPGVGGAIINRGNIGDDFELASTSTFLYGSGHNFPGMTQAANGDFSLTFNDFALTTKGEAYFTSPVPFHMQFTIDGNFGSFPVPGLNGSSIITGAANVTFVPEPGIAALFGIALLGLGLTRRRQAK